VKFYKNPENTQLSRINHSQSVHANAGRKARQHSWTTHTMNSALAIVLALATVITFVSSANAASCRNVDILLDNQTQVRIKALYAHFKCEGENEKKEMFNNVEVPETTKLPVGPKQDLQGCKDKKMEYIKVHYKVRCGDGSWSNEKFVRDESFLNAYCSSDAGKKYTVVLLATDPQATCN
jgi:hypothetical protein